MAMVRNGKTILDGIGEGNSAREVNAAAAEDGATIIMTCNRGQGAHTYTHACTRTHLFTLADFHTMPCISSHLIFTTDLLDWQDMI